MSFGFGIGDLLALLELANKIRKDFVSAPKDCKELYNQTRTLSERLHDLDDVLSRGNLSAKQDSSLRDAGKQCKAILEDLNTFIQKNSNLQTSGSVANQLNAKVGLREESRRIWKRLSFKSEEVIKLQQRLVLMLSNLNTVYDSLVSAISHDTYNEVKHLSQQFIQATIERDQSNRDEEERFILDWITPDTYSGQQNDILSKCQDGTGGWFLTSPEYLKWRSGEPDHQTLLCAGIPGAGKTVMVSLIVNDLRKHYATNNDVYVIYFYCDFKRTEQQRLLDILSTLTRQLLEHVSPFPDDARTLKEHHKKDKTRPSRFELVDLLEVLLATATRSFIIIDALDECRSDDRTLPFMLDALFGLQAKLNGTLSLLSTTRAIPEILDRFRDATELEIRASEEDIGTYLDDQMSRLSQSIFKKSDLHTEIKIAINDCVQGMFLLARLHFDSLIDKTTPKAIRNALKALPKGSEALFVAYNDVRRRIDGQPNGFRNLAKEVLSWMTWCQRPMTVRELQHALAITPEAQTIDDEEDSEDHSTIVSVCLGLVTIDPVSSVIGLVHYTTQEFLIQVRAEWLSSTSSKIPQSCLAYLSLNTFATGWCSEHAYQTRLKMNPFFEYAAQFWSFHVAQYADTPQLIDSLRKFLSSEGNVCAAYQFLLRPYCHELWRDLNPLLSILHDLTIMSYEQIEAHSDWRTLFTPLHWATLAERAEDVKLIMACDNNAAGVSNSFGQTPLSWAIRRENYEIAELLLAQENLGIDTPDANGRTPMSHTARSNRLDIVRLLLEKGNVNLDSRDTEGRTPLSHAAGLSSRDIVRFLLDRENTVLDSKDTEGRTPLMYAAMNGDVATVEMLLDKNSVDVDSQDNAGRTPLMYACQYGHRALRVAELLLKRGANVNMRDELDRTALYYAACQSWPFREDDVVEILLAKNADVNAADFSGRTPLSSAAILFSVPKIACQVMQGFLTTPEASVDLKDSCGRTMLSYAAAKGNYDAMQFLLDKGASPHLSDPYGRTPLSYASEAFPRNDGCVSLILSLGGVSVDSKDSFGRTPLSYAAGKGDFESVAELVINGASPDTEDHEGRSPISYATTSFSWVAGRVVAVLLMAGAVDIDTKDSCGRTPLSYAADLRYYKDMHINDMLKAHGIYPDVAVDLRRYPSLSIALEGFKKNTWLLLAKGASPNTMDHLGRTPLSYAASSLQPANVEMLLAKGASPDTVDHSGRTPLSYAAETGHKGIIELLLAHGARSTTRDNAGRTPLSYAEEDGDEESIRLLQCASQTSLRTRRRLSV